MNFLVYVREGKCWPDVKWKDKVRSTCMKELLIKGEGLY